MSRKQRIKRRVEYNTDLNLAPFIDTLLVLLIVFMIPSQQVFNGLKLNLPSAAAKIVVLKKDPIKIFILNDDKININNQIIEYKDIVKIVDDLSLKDKYIKIYVMADKDSKYGQVLNVVGKLNENNFKNVTLITDIHNRI